MDYRVKNIYGRTTKNRVTVEVPGSKSITARALLIAALARGKSTLFGAGLSDDCQTFIKCLKDLGIEVSVQGTTVNVEGCGGTLPLKRASLNVGSAGTAARFITALLALQRGEYRVDCSEQMRRRPIAPLICALEQLGASFTYEGERYCFPFTVRGALKAADKVTVDIEKSSQFLSALLISAVCAGKPLTVRTVGRHGPDYVNMTLDMMWSFGVSVEERGGAYTVSGGYSAKRYDIEPDLSAACYFYAAGRILGADIAVKGVMPHSMQGDSKFIELVKDFDGGTVDMGSFSDQALTLAAIAPYFSRPTEITGIGHIRGQECDRISAIARNLSAMGVKCEERADGVKIYPSQPRGARIATFGDHRVAMSFALTGLRADGVVIENAGVCSKTFKNYFDVLEGLCTRLTENN